MKKEGKKLLLYLLINTVALIAIYYLVARVFPYIPLIYLLIGGGLGLYYVIYNKGMTGRGVTPEMLPDTMTLEEKQAWIADRAERSKKSRWVLTLLFPIILTLGIDMILIFLLPMMGVELL